ncbi:MAG: universal stress protein [Acidimicrobiia bacterium]
MAGEIVVGYDGSDCAKAAVAFAADVAAHYDTGLSIVFCVEPPAVLAGGAAGDQRRAIEALGEDLLAAAEALVQGRDITVHREIVDARPAEGLVAAADEHDAPVIVIGTNSSGPLASAILGSTPHKLLHLSRRPVLVVPAHD